MSPKGFFAGLLLGGLLGAGISLLYAPQSGEKTRKQLKEKADEAKVKGHLAKKEAMEKAGLLKDKIDEGVDDARDRAYKAKKALKKKNS